MGGPLRAAAADGERWRDIEVGRMVLQEKDVGIM